MDLTQFSPSSALLTVVVLALAPFVAVMVTSFTKIVVVLNLLRNALGLQQVPPNTVINGLALAADELDALEAGGAVVLPESMRPDWRGVLRARGEPLASGAPLALATPHAPQVVARDAATPALSLDAGAVMCEVRLAGTPMVAIERLAGWQPGSVGHLGERAVLWRCDGVSRRCAAGTLMPWGDGWALAIDTVQPG